MAIIRLSLLSALLFVAADDSYDLAGYCRGSITSSLSSYWGICTSPDAVNGVQTSCIQYHSKDADGSNNMSINKEHIHWPCRFDMSNECGEVEQCLNANTFRMNYSKCLAKKLAAGSQTESSAVKRQKCITEESNKAMDKCDLTLNPKPKTDNPAYLDCESKVVSEACLLHTSGNSTVCSATVSTGKGECFDLTDVFSAKCTKEGIKTASKCVADTNEYRDNCQGRELLKYFFKEFVKKANSFNDKAASVTACQESTQQTIAVCKADYVAVASCANTTTTPPTIRTCESYQYGNKTTIPVVPVLIKEDN